MSNSGDREQAGSKAHGQRESADSLSAMSDIWRIALFIAYLFVASRLLIWVAGVIAVRCGYPRAYGRQILASAGTCLLFKRKPPAPAIPVSKEDERLAAITPATPGPRSRPSDLTG
jgi:hypothetical protein